MTSARKQPVQRVAPKKAAPRTVSKVAPAEMAGVERLRQARIRPDWDRSLAPEMDRAIREAVALRRATSGCAQAWSTVVPEPLLARTVLEGVARGILTVRVPDAATRFELDRFLRSGGQKRLLTECRTSITKVRLVVGSGPARPD